MKLIALTMVTDERPAVEYRYDEEREVDVPVEAPEVTVPVTVNAEFIRCFYKRKGDKPGTRITFGDGRGFAVKETYEEVLDKVACE